MSTQETIQEAYRAIKNVRERNYLSYQLALELNRAPCVNTQSAFQTFADIIGWMDSDLLDIMQDLDSVIEDRKAVHHD
mgnify:CR=1 FL=1